MDTRQKYLKKFLERLPAFQAIFRAAEAEGIVNLENNWKEPILDLGCGDGIFSEILLGKGKNIVGVDLDQKSLDEAKKSNIYQKLVNVDAKALPFKKGMFSSVLANSSLEHIANPEPVLKEIFRVLAKGGEFVLTAPSEKREKYFLLGKAENDFFKHFNCWSGKEWEGKLKKIGFRRVLYLYKGSPVTCLIGDILLPFSLLGFIERKIFGHYLRWRKFIAPVLFLFLKRMKDEVEENNGAVIIVKAEK